MLLDDGFVPSIQFPWVFTARSAVVIRSTSWTTEIDTSTTFLVEFIPHLFCSDHLLRRRKHLFIDVVYRHMLADVAFTMDRDAGSVKHLGGKRMKFLGAQIITICFSDTIMLTLIEMVDMCAADHADHDVR